MSKKPPSEVKKSNTSDLEYPSYRPPALAPCLARRTRYRVCGLLLTLVSFYYRLASNHVLRGPIIAARGHFSNSQTTGEPASEI